MIKVVFLGFGNVNSHLLEAFLNTEKVRVEQVFNRNYIKMISPFEHIPFTDDVSKLKEADVYIIGIPDDAISAFSENLPFKNKLVVHTSGGVAIDTLCSKNRRGIFYPLQSFSKQREVDFKHIPIFLESENDDDLTLLRNLAESISEAVTEISSEQRAKLHVAAVFVNNFSNYLYQIGSEILKEEDLRFSFLKPLIMETASKIETLSPEEAQTGPAKRNDIKTIEKHLSLLKNPLHIEFYKLFTEALQKK